MGGKVWVVTPPLHFLRPSIAHITRHAYYEILRFPGPTSKVNKWLFRVMFLKSDINWEQLFEASVGAAAGQPS